MNIILLDKDEINGDHTTLKDHRAEHIVKVLRSSRGDRVTVGIINGKTGYGIIKEIVGRKPYLVKLQLALERYPDITPPIDILLALPRPIVFKRIISHLTTLGVRRILVVNAAKVEKSYWESSVVSENGWQRHVREGLEQAVDTRLVDISFYRGFKPFMQEIVPGIKDRYQQMLVAHPHTTNNLAEVFRAGASPVLLAIGPEGGWNEYELDQMELMGFDQFTLGARVLRVETAVNALHGAISMLRSMPENL